MDPSMDPVVSDAPAPAPVSLVEATGGVDADAADVAVSASAPMDPHSVGHSKMSAEDVAMLKKRALPSVSNVAGVAGVMAAQRAQAVAPGMALLPRMNFANLNFINMQRAYPNAQSQMPQAFVPTTGKRKRGGKKSLGDEQKPCPGSVLLPVDNLEDMAFVLLVNDLRQNYDARYHSRIGLADNAHGLYMNKAGEKIAELVTRPPAFDLFLGDHVTKKRGRKPKKSLENTEEAKAVEPPPEEFETVQPLPETVENVPEGLGGVMEPPGSGVPHLDDPTDVADAQDVMADADDPVNLSVDDPVDPTAQEVETSASGIAVDADGDETEEAALASKIVQDSPMAATATKSKSKTKREPKPEPEWDPAVKHHWAFRSSLCEGWLPLKKGAGRTSRVCESCSKVVNALRRRAKNLMELQQKRHKEGVHVETLRHDFIARDPELALSHLQRQTTLINKLRREARAARQSNLLLEQERRVTSFKVATLQQTLIDVQKNANESAQKQLARHLRDAVPLLKFAFPDESPGSLDLESRAFFTSAFNNIAKLADGSSRNGFRYSIEVIKTAKHYIHKLGKNYYKRLAQTILWPSKRHVQIFISKEKQRDGEEEKAQDVAEREREQSATDGMLSIATGPQGAAQAKETGQSNTAAAKATGRTARPAQRKRTGGRGGGRGGNRPSSEAKSTGPAPEPLHEALQYPGQPEAAHLAAAASVAAGGPAPPPESMMQGVPGGYVPGLGSPGSAQSQVYPGFNQYTNFGNNPWIFNPTLPNTDADPQPRGPTNTRRV